MFTKMNLLGFVKCITKPTKLKFEYRFYMINQILKIMILYKINFSLKFIQYDIHL